MTPEAQEANLIREFFGSTDPGAFIDVGANDPIGGSQSYPLEQAGWTGILVEPQATLYGRLVACRPQSTVFQKACGAPEKAGPGRLFIPDENGFATLEKNIDDHRVQYRQSQPVEVVTLDALIAEWRQQGHPARIRFVSIDVEGTELDVLKGFSLEQHRPDLILIEDKLQALDKHRYLRAHGYRLVKRTCLNNWYVPVGAPFQLTSWGERLRLFRKVFLGLPFRALRRWRHRRRLSAGFQP